MSLSGVGQTDLRRLSRAQRERLSEQLGRLAPPPPVRYCPHAPHPKQWAGLLYSGKEMLYGGAAGGGKSDYLLMAALQYVDVPGYAALLLRRTFSQLDKADGLIQRAHEWLSKTDAQWNGTERRWTFPSGARVEFGHLQHDSDRFNYQSAAYQFVGFDELTQFSEVQYRYLFSRLRRLEGSGVPIRMRAASNPGGDGHEWVKARFVEPGDPSRPFLSAKLADNVSLDRDEYRGSLSHLDPVTRRQLEDGDWTARHGGGMFRRESFRIVDALPEGVLESVRYWDLAATEASDGKDPDWSVGCLMHRERSGRIYISDVTRFRARPGQRDVWIRNTAEMDGVAIPIIVEQEPGASGKSQLEYLVTNVLSGFRVTGERAMGKKAARAGPFASQVDVGNVSLLRGTWNVPFLDELESFDGSGTGHDDQVDAVSGAFKHLNDRRGGSVFVGELRL